MPARQPEECDPAMLIDSYKPHTRIVVLERLSLVTLSVTWSDPTLGHFAGQVWRKGPAHIDTFCALTGVPIRLGDPVFRPRSHDSHVPANADRMILESSLNLQPKRSLSPPRLFDCLSVTDSHNACTRSTLDIAETRHTGRIVCRLFRELCRLHSYRSKHVCNKTGTRE